MAKYHYWTNFDQSDDDEVLIDTTTPLVTLTPALRRTDDTLLRFIAWAELGVTVGPSALPNLDWLTSATVDWLWYFDLASSGFQVNIVDNNPLTLGFTRLNKSVWTTPTANKYIALWQGPPEGVDVHVSRKGDGVNIPALSSQRWVSDNHGVFDNFASFGVSFTSRLVGRALWASDDPPPP